MKYVLFISTKQLKHRTEVNLPKPTELINGSQPLESHSGYYPGYCYNHPSLAELFRGLNQTRVKAPPVGQLRADAEWFEWNGLGLRTAQSVEESRALTLIVLIG